MSECVGGWVQGVVSVSVCVCVCVCCVCMGVGECGCVGVREQVINRRY